MSQEEKTWSAKRVQTRVAEIEEKGLETALKDATDQEKILEEKREEKTRKRSRRNSVRKAAYGIAKTTINVATGSVLEASLGLAKTAHGAYKESQNREAEAYNKSKFISQDRIEAVDNFMEENMDSDTKLELTEFILEKWGNNKTIKGLVEKIEKGEGIPHSVLEKALKAKAPRAYDELQDKIKEAIDKMSLEKQAELNKAIAGDDKTKVAVNVAALITAFERNSQQIGSSKDSAALSASPKKQQQPQKIGPPV